MLNQVVHFAVDPAEGMGVSSLAAASDGTVYACSASTLFGFLP